VPGRVAYVSNRLMMIVDRTPERGPDVGQSGTNCRRSVSGYMS